MTYYFNANSQLLATVHRSFDTFKFPQDTLYTTQSTRLSQGLNPQSSFNLTATQSDYRFFLNGLTNIYRYRSTIRQRDARLDWLYMPFTKHRLESGGSLTGCSLLPGAIAPTGDNSHINTLTLPTEQGREWAGYVSEEWTPFRVLSVQVRVRYVQFVNVGRGWTISLPKGSPAPTRALRIRSVAPASRRWLSTAPGNPACLTIRANVSQNSSLKVSYNRTGQYIHLISNTTAISSVDFWNLSNALVQPQVADQFAVGYFQNLKDNQYENSVEVYHKTLENIVEYRNSATLLLNPILDADLVRGKGRVYGVEVSIQKTRGLLTGLIAYTYSRMLARVPSRTPASKSTAATGTPPFPTGPKI